MFLFNIYLLVTQKRNIMSQLTDQLNQNFSKALVDSSTCYVRAKQSRDRQM